MALDAVGRLSRLIDEHAHYYGPEHKVDTIDLARALLAELGPTAAQVFDSDLPAPRLQYGLSRRDDPTQVTGVDYETVCDPERRTRGMVRQVLALYGPWEKLPLGPLTDH